MAWFQRLAGYDWSNISFWGHLPSTADSSRKAISRLQWSQWITWSFSWDIGHICCLSVWVCLPLSSTFSRKRHISNCLWKVHEINHVRHGYTKPFIVSYNYWVYQYKWHGCLLDRYITDTTLALCNHSPQSKTFLTIQGIAALCNVSRNWTPHCRLDGFN